MSVDDLFGAPGAHELDAPMPVLKITCTSYDCPNDLHCFKPMRSMTEEELGSCRGCGEHLVDWTRLHKRDIDDFEYTFESLRREMIRQHMWQRDIDATAMRKAEKQGRHGVLAGVRGRLASSIGKAANGFDGRQTPMDGRIVYYAQHATATCCRKCLEYWHDIPPNRALTEEEVDYCESLAKIFIESRIGNLPAKPHRR
jgi:hypothetical protein